MPQVTNTGLFKGEIKDHAVTLTKKSGLPQFIVTLLATGYYDEAAEGFADYSDRGETATGYLVLIYKDEKGNPVNCLNYTQVMEATGWDGETWPGLSSMDLKGKVVQFRVAEDDFNGKVSMKVVWIAADDAQIGLRKSSDKELAAMQAAFPIGSGGKKTAASPARAKAKGPKTPTETEKTPPKAPKAKTEESAVEEEKPDLPDVKPCTEDEGYEACVKANEAMEKPVPEEVLNDYWSDALTVVSADAEKPTDEEYAKVRDKVLADIAPSDDIPF